MKIVLPVEYAFLKMFIFCTTQTMNLLHGLLNIKNSPVINLIKPCWIGDSPLNGRHYPLPKKSMMKLANRYHSDMPENVFSIGRAGTYRYSVDIDDCIEQGLLVAQMIKAGAFDGHPVPILSGGR